MYQWMIESVGLTVAIFVVIFAVIFVVTAFLMPIFVYLIHRNIIKLILIIESNQAQLPAPRSQCNFVIHGAERKTGKTVRIVLAAENEEAAKVKANKSGILVETVRKSD